MLDNIVERIKSLPPLPESFQKINKICKDENGTVGQLAKAIEEDPMLVANLLKVANSPLYCFRREIRSVLQAVSLFSMSTTRALTVDISIKKLLKVDIEPYGISPDDFVNISGMQSRLMKEWYTEIDSRKLETLFLAALLQETGKILIADEILKNNEMVQFRSEIERTFDISEVEKSFIDTTTAEITSKIFEHWGFDDTIVESIFFTGNTEEAPAHIKEYSIALKIIKTAVPMNNPLSEDSIKRALNLAQKEGYDKILLSNSIDKILELCK